MKTWAFFVTTLYFFHRKMCATASLKGCDSEVDLAIVLDESESIADNDPVDAEGTNWMNYIKFAHKIIQHIEVGGQRGARVSLIVYSNYARVVFGLNDHRNANSMLRQVAALKHNGGLTNTSGALRMVRQRVFTAGSRIPLVDDGDLFRSRTVVLITDGMATVDRESTLNESSLVKSLDANKVAVFTVGITKEVDSVELRQVASTPLHHFIHVANFQDLQFYAETLSSRICKLPEPHIDECKKDLDIIFMVDSSGSIRQAPMLRGIDNWDMVRQFVVTMLNLFAVDVDSTHVGAIQFSKKAEILSPLSGVRKSVATSVLTATYLNGQTNTAAGLRLARKMFANKQSNRSDRHNVLVVVTDGKSNLEVNDTVPEALRAKNNATIFVVGVTSGIDEVQAKAIASNPTDDHYFDANFISLVDISTAVVRGVCRVSNPQTGGGTGSTVSGSSGMLLMTSLLIMLIRCFRDF